MNRASAVVFVVLFSFGSARSAKSEPPESQRIPIGSCTALAAEADAALGRGAWDEASGKIDACLALNSKDKPCLALAKKVRVGRTTELAAQALKQVEDKLFSDAKATADSCLALDSLHAKCRAARKKAELGEQRELESTQQLARHIYVNKWNAALVSAGMLNSEATIGGPKDTVFTVYWPGINANMIDYLEKQGVFRPTELKELGFKRFVVRPRDRHSDTPRHHWNFDLSKF